MNELKSQQEELLQNRKIEIDNMVEESEEKLKQAMDKTKYEADLTHRHDISSLKSEMTTQINCLEKECKNYKSSFEELQNDLVMSKEELERILHEKKMLEGTHEKVLKVSNMSFLKFIIHCIKNDEQHKQIALSKKLEHESAIESMNSKCSLIKNNYDNLVSYLREEIRSRNQQRKRIRTVLRDKSSIMFDFRNECLQISSELKNIIAKQETAETDLKILDDDASQMQDGLHELEKQIQYHAQTSAIQDGRINMAHARKKRRLDEE